jgi:small subunit ribosomal protein S6
MKKYEMLCVLPGTVAESEVSPVVTEIKEQLAAQGAEDMTFIDLGKSRLAYPVKHIRYGYFGLYTFNLDPVKVATLERNIRLLGSLLRVSIQVHNPKQTATVSLALDPTALSAPEKEEAPRGYRSDRGEARKEVTAPKAVVAEEKVVKTAEPQLNLENIDAKLDEILQKDIDKV